MRKILSSTLLFFAFLFVSFGFSKDVVSAYQNPGNPTGFVNDFAGMLTLEQKSSLENKLRVFEKETTNEISVVIIQSLGGDTVENFAEKLFQEWSIGKKRNLTSGQPGDNGALLLIALDDRQMRIEVGYGLEGSLTDILSSRIIRETLTPSFQVNDFYGGINTAIDQMIQIVGGSVPGSLISVNEEQHSVLSVLWSVFVFIVWIFLIIKYPWLLFFMRGSGGFGGGRRGGGFGGFGGGRSGGGGASGKW